MTPNPKPQDDGIDGPAVERGFVQDRTISPVAGATKAWRRLDGLAYLLDRKLIAGHQRDAGTRLQEDYQTSLMEAGARSGGCISNGGRGKTEIPDSAIMAGARVKAALAVLPPELLSMTVLFLLPDFSKEALSLEKIAARVREDKRSITLGVRAALSLLARHYGS